MKSPDYLWYASYGSNLLFDRFKCYIEGGIPTGAMKKQKGCTDKTLPVKNQIVNIDHPLYFAEWSDSWGGAVAFIDDKIKKPTSTLGRMYLIKKPQFEELVKQENDDIEQLEIDYDLLNQKGSTLISNSLWYGKLLNIGYQDNFPIYTFTNNRYRPERAGVPSDSYLRTIIRGMMEIRPEIDPPSIADLLNPYGLPQYKLDYNRISKLLQ